MSKVERKRKHIGILVVGIITLIMSLVVYRQFIIGDNLFVYNDVGGDTKAAYIPFYYYTSTLVSNVLNGNGIDYWSRVSGLGNNIFIYGMNVIDPFMLPVYLLPADFIAGSMVYVHITKIVFSALVSYLFFSKRGSEEFTCIVLAITYAFSGYMLVWGQHYAFATFYALIPLMLYGLERLMQNGNWKIYVLSIILLSTQLHLFYAIAFFIVIYSIIRYYELEEKYSVVNLVKWLFNIGWYSLLGILLNAVLLIPIIFATFNTNRIGLSIVRDYKQVVTPSIKDIIAYWLRYFNPTITYDLSMYNNKFYDYYQAPNVYIGMLPITILSILPLIIKNMNKRKKKFIGIYTMLAVTLLMTSFFKYFFNMFAAQNFRWHYVYVIILILIFGYLLDEIVSDAKIVSKSSFVMLFIPLILVSVYFISIYLKLDTENEYTLAMGFILPCFFIVVYGILLKFFATRKYLLKSLIVVTVLIELVLVSNRVINEDRVVLEKGHIFDDLSINSEYKKNDYRIDKEYNSISENDSLMQDYYGVKSYTSLQNGDFKELMYSVNVRGWTNFNRGFNDVNSLYTLANVKKYYGNNSPEFFEPLGGGVFENPYRYSDGTVFNKVVRKSVYSLLPQELKERILLEALVIDDIDFEDTMIEMTLTDIKDRYPVADIEISGEIVYKKYIATEEETGKVVLEVTETDPQIIVPIDKNSYTNDGYNVIFTLQSEQNSVGVLYYLVEGKYKNISFLIPQGESDYSYFIEDTGLEFIRLDIGEEKGEKFVIEDLHLVNGGVMIRSKSIVMPQKIVNLETIAEDDLSEYRVTTNDPQIHYLLDGNTNKDSTVLLISMLVKSDSEAQLFYAQANQGYDENNSLRFNVSVSQSEYLVRIPSGSKSIRLDIGKESDVYKLTSMEIVEEIEQDYYKYFMTSSKSVTDLNWEDDRIEASIKTKEKGMLFFSVPFDEGWNAKINGEEIEVLKVDLAFMAVPIESGESNIEFYFKPRGLNLGVLLSLVGAILCVLVQLDIVNMYKSRKKRGTNEI